MGEGQGWWIREPCPARAQAAGGNASGKPPYRCFNLEDALATACSRCTWPERMLWILTACLDFQKSTRVKNNAWLDCSEHSDLNTLFESEMNPRKTKALTDRREETSSLNTSCFDYNCLRRTFCFHHWSVQHVTAHFERAQPAEEVKPTLPLLTEGSDVEGPARLVIQVDTQVPVIRHQMNLRFQSLRSRLRPYRARSPSAR